MKNRAFVVVDNLIAEHNLSLLLPHGERWIRQTEFSQQLLYIV